VPPQRPDVKVVFASTRQITVASAQTAARRRGAATNPVDVNGIDKMAGEQYHILYNDVYRLRSTVLRLTNTTALACWEEQRQTFIGWFLRQVIDSEEITIFVTDRSC